MNEKTDFTMFDGQEARNINTIRFCEKMRDELRPTLPHGLTLNRVEVVAGLSTPVNMPEHDYCAVRFHCKSPGVKKGASGHLSVFSDEFWQTAHEVKEFMRQFGSHLTLQDAEVLPDYDQTVGSSDYRGTTLWFQFYEKSE